MQREMETTRDRAAQGHPRAAAGDRRKRRADAPRDRRADRCARRAQPHRRAARPGHCGAGAPRRAGRGEWRARRSAPGARSRRGRRTPDSAPVRRQSAAAPPGDRRAPPEPPAEGGAAAGCPTCSAAPGATSRAARAGDSRQTRRAMESLDSLSVDIARMIDHDAAAELWERYKRGERNVFTRRLYTMQGQKTFEEIRKPLSRRPRVQADGRPLYRRVRAAAGGGVAGRARPGDRRAAISPPTPARSTPCWRTRRGGSRATAEPDAGCERQRARCKPRPCRFARGSGIAARMASAHSPHRALADRRQPSRSRAARRPRPTWWSSRSPTARHRGAANACPMRAMARRSTGVTAALEAMRGALGGRSRPAGAAGRDAGGRRAQRARLRVLGSRGESERGKPVHVLAGLAGAGTAGHRLHDLARDARGDGRGGRARRRRENCSR